MPQMYASVDAYILRVIISEAYGPSMPLWIRYCRSEPTIWALDVRLSSISCRSRSFLSSRGGIRGKGFPK